MSVDPAGSPHARMHARFVDFYRRGHGDVIRTDNRLILMAAATGRREIIGIGGRIRVRWRQDVMRAVTIMTVGKKIARDFFFEAVILIGRSDIGMAAAAIDRRHTIRVRYG